MYVNCLQINPKDLPTKETSQDYKCNLLTILAFLAMPKIISKEIT